MRWPGKVMHPLGEPYYCPECAHTVEETIWVWQGKWYCSEACCRKRAAGY